MSSTHFIALAGGLFAIGMIGAIMRRNAIVVLMCVELMLNAANLLFLTYAKQYGDVGGHVLALFVIAIAAAEAAVGLAIIIGVFRTKQTLDINELDSLREDV
ncbi:MAG: NADH-quinone oxidoreductase subunit NuoK [Deltaproteobacteria bacterium]|nr:NADH-quinone oxidoreductase subunit NuoK [Deltaproteobacteria bacterium]